MAQLKQITKNCHVISRFLTKGWEDDKRELWYYDFSANAFSHKTSKKLYSAFMINQQAVEEWLDQVLEKPLSLARDKLLAGDQNALEEWRFYRAAVLMLWLQGARSKTVRDEDARRGLDKLAAAPDSEIDALAAGLAQDFDLMVVGLMVDRDRVAPLFFPSTGTFPVVVWDAGCLSGHSICLGLPLDPGCALVAAPKNKGGLLDQSKLQGSIANCSVGIDRARRVVVLPASSRRRRQASAAAGLNRTRGTPCGNGAGILSPWTAIDCRRLAFRNSPGTTANLLQLRHYSAEVHGNRTHRAAPLSEHHRF
jgi:hypothetical protein